MRIFLNAKLQCASKLRNAFALLVERKFLALVRIQSVDERTQTTQTKRLDNQTKK